MFDFDHDNLPKYLSTLFLRRNDVHDRNFRDKSKNPLYTAHRYNNIHQHIITYDNIMYNSRYIII